MNRRDFLRRAAALVAAPTVPAVSFAAPAVAAANVLTIEKLRAAVEKLKRNNVPASGYVTIPYTVEAYERALTA